jgi:chorismate mutase
MARPPDTLDSMREDVDRIDAALVVLLAERYSIVQGIARVKTRQGLPMHDEARETWIKERGRLLGARFGLGDYGRDLVTLAMTCCKGAFAPQPRRKYPRAPHPKPAR